MAQIEEGENMQTTFISKLKEQSFTIILMIAGLYYQNMIFNEQLERYTTLVNQKQQYIDKIVEDERQRFIAREQYLMQQRDSFIEMLKEKNNANQ
jgi:hypothetical protein